MVNWEKSLWDRENFSFEQGKDALEHIEVERLSTEFGQIENLCDLDLPITVGGVLEHLEHRGHALLTLFLAGPFLVPLPLPGLSVPFGVFIAFFAFAMAFGRKPFLPKSWLAREIPKDTLRKFCRMAVRFFKKFEALFKPRLVWLVDFRAAQFTIAFMIAFCGILLALPLPPGTNSPPSSVIIALSIGFLERDGILVLIGYILFLLNIAFFTFLAVFGYEGVMNLIRMF
jgi:hypothetical protein